MRGWNEYFSDEINQIFDQGDFRHSIIRIIYECYAPGTEYTSYRRAFEWAVDSSRPTALDVHIDYVRLTRLARENAEGS